MVVLAVSLAPSKAQAQENFAWITNTNGVTWKKKIHSRGLLHFIDESPWSDDFSGERPKIASIFVPEHAKINYIEVYGCVNLTNIVLLPAFPKDHPHFTGKRLSIHNMQSSGLRTITCKKTMRDSIQFHGGWVNFQGEGWSIQRAVQWIDLEPPQIDIRKLTTATGPELEIIWRNGTLQIADAVNGKWEDYSGSSPLRVPLWKDKQFFRIRKRDE